jgi:hypothetical protein
MSIVKITVEVVFRFMTFPKKQCDMTIIEATNAVAYHLGMMRLSEKPSIAGRQQAKNSSRYKM